MYWPAFENERLADFAKSLRKRSKALKHKTEVLSCERVFEVEGPDRLEKAEVAMRDYHQTRLRFFLWADSWAWVDARLSSKSGWVWEWSYEGRLLGRYGGRDLVAALETTLFEAHSMTASDINGLTQIWQPFLARGPRAID